MPRRRRLSRVELLESQAITSTARALVALLRERHEHENDEIGFVGLALKRLEQQLAEQMTTPEPAAAHNPV
jgi:hypothetical protein